MKQQTPPAEPEAGTHTRRIIAWGLVGSFAVVGAFVAPYLFPDQTLWRSVLGGVLLGAFSGICAVYHQLIE